MLTPRTKKRMFILFCATTIFFFSFLHNESSKMNVVELTNKIQNTLNKLINKNDLRVETTELSNELLETLKVIENCKDKKIDGIDLDGFHESIDGIESRLAELEEAEEKDHIFYKLNEELFVINIRLNKEILCEGCKEKEIEKLTDKCGNEEIARFLYDCKLNANYDDGDVYIRWIPFDKFRNVEYLAKGGFGEVHKATWINEDYEVVLKRIYNSSDDKIVDILNEVK